MLVSYDAGFVDGHIVSKANLLPLTWAVQHVFSPLEKKSPTVNVKCKKQQKGNSVWATMLSGEICFIQARS